MRAIHIDEFGGPEGLSVASVSDPAPPVASEVLVRVRAAALNRADILQRRGLYPAPAGFPERVPGLEFAGEVEAVGPKVEVFEPGDRVFGITAGGAQAEYIVTDEALLARVPYNIDLVDAAAVPEAFITAYDAMFSQAAAKKGESMLVHSVASGVGLAALQLGKAKGIKVIGTSRSAEKLFRCSAFGIDAALLVDEEVLFAEAVKDATEGRGADFVVDLVGARYLNENLRSLKTTGRLVFVGLTGGAKGEIDLASVISKRLMLKGTVLRSRSIVEKALLTEIFAEGIVPLLAEGRIVANVDKVFGMGDVRAAHEYLESNATFGKVVLEI
jgi:putative PIG3 family NAD(P)H quinone oxidoreductase